MTDGEIAFHVRGIPVTQGSAHAFVLKGGKRAVVVPDHKRELRAWRSTVSYAAQQVAPSPVWTGPVAIALRFTLPRPKTEPTHRGRGKARRPIRTWPDRRPDLDKLARSVLDALTGVVFGDDCQVVRLEASKDWGDPGVAVEISRVAEGGG